MEESQCVEEQDHSETNTEDEPDYKIAEVTSNGRLKSFFVSENEIYPIVNLVRQRLLLFQRA